MSESNQNLVSESEMDESDYESEHSLDLSVDDKIEQNVQDESNLESHVNEVEKNNDFTEQINYVHDLINYLEAVNLDKYRSKHYISSQINKNYKLILNTLNEINDPEVKVLINNMRLKADFTYNNLKSTMREKFV
jgi:hypothetical protein